MSDKEVVEVGAPIPFPILKRSFKEDIVFKINADDSKLSGERLLSYLHNLQVEHELNHGSRLLELVESYLHLNVIYNDPSLVPIVTTLMLRYRGVDISYNGIEDAALDEIIERNKDILELWVIRASSIIAFSLHVFQPTKELAKEYPVDDISYNEYGKFSTKGINFIHVITAPMVHFYVPYIMIEDVRYSEQMFNEYLFAGKCMLDYCNAPDNPFLLSLFDNVDFGDLDVPLN